MADLHASVRARIPAYRHGLLDAAAAQEVRAHLRECAPCHAAFAPFLEPTDEEETRAGHVPIALITRWEVFAPRLSPAERGLLEAHFAACDRCRESREFAGSIRTRRPAEGRGRKGWLGFGTAALAAVIAVATLAVLRERPAPTPATAPTPEAAAPRTSPAPPPVSVRAPTVALAGRSRSGGANQAVRVPSGSTVLPIRVPPLLGVPPDARIEIRVDGPGGVEFGHTELAHHELFGTSQAASLDAQAPEGPLPAGHYRVMVTSNAPDPQVPGEFEGAEYDFDLSVIPDSVN